jgi:hypothetical protein
LATPFDDVIADIKKRGYHNHRLEDHSDTVSKGIFQDLLKRCKPFKEDWEASKIDQWLNVPAPGARHRKIDLFVGEKLPDSKNPDLDRLRICLENKSVVTAHRNRDARFDDLNESLQVLHKVKPEAVLVATVMIGTAQQVLNVPDKIKPMYKDRIDEFDKKVLPRLSSGDHSLWKEFRYAISDNRATDPEKTLEKFRGLPQRQPGHTHVVGYDFLLFVPVYIDNVNPPYVDRSNFLGIDIDKEYAAMLDRICKAYQTRWHL